MTSTPVQAASLVLGAVFLLVGILGFIPGVTSNLDQLAGAGHDSGAMLVGLFQVSVLHNIVHIVFGVAGIAAARLASAAGIYLLLGGFIYLGLWVFGLVIDKDESANFIPLNSADDWLHFTLGAGMIMLGILLTRGSRAAARTNIS
ncbi:DUF4383 domain-containing protein [Rhodococcus sp. ZPP]|uniref:DUF4383 domain-containing protein n=1 Tax=Rhodococcus sp. ZPP TaxID=2749906 RepID=UPI001AD899E7|nr:DUF4383 domain-containing protein [Rhodococcus sp. ZPP]QTJ67242.1 DUF4383 domain-containing protein [Rhodococcus sp. ZPP]